MICAPSKTYPQLYPHGMPPKKDFEKLDKRKTKERHHYKVLRNFKYRGEMFQTGDIIEIGDLSVGSLLIKYNYVR